MMMCPSVSMLVKITLLERTCRQIQFRKMTHGLLQPDTGQLFSNGEPVLIDGYNMRQLRIGMAFQHFSLFDALTVAETSSW